MRYLSPPTEQITRQEGKELDLFPTDEFFLLLPEERIIKGALFQLDFQHLSVQFPGTWSIS